MNYNLYRFMLIGDLTTNTFETRIEHILYIYSELIHSGLVKSGPTHK